MKRITALLLSMVLALSLCACTGQSKPVRYASKGWEAIGSADIEVDEIFFMEYTSRTYLSDEVLETDMYHQIPARGYAVLFDSYSFKGHAFMDSFACFFNSDGQLEFCFDYGENYALYEKHYANYSPNSVSSGKKALEYLTNCNYISGMINYADDAEEMKGTLQKNVWYAFSEKQIDKIVD